ncbi:hypothetical protein MLD38_026198 [Melastoma candidum]|uniref:Uncharacterized protein n=1 Tax=Melastoma candidum TaxID=119954 RepID=A0ACB9P112_9MYRT|nr:hypothetical protein MLD38_026198 [Melastoma candidum]
MLSKRPRVPSMTDHFGFTMASINETGCVFANLCKGDKNLSTLMHRPFSREEVKAMALGDGWVAAVTIIHKRWFAGFTTYTTSDPAVRGTSGAAAASSTAPALSAPLFIKKLKSRDNNDIIGRKRLTQVHVHGPGNLSGSTQMRMRQPRRNPTLNDLPFLHRSQLMVWVWRRRAARKITNSCLCPLIHFLRQQLNKDFAFNLVGHAVCNCNKCKMQIWKQTRGKMVFRH